MNRSFLTIKSDAEELPRFDAEGQPLLPHGWPFTRDGQARAEKKYVVFEVTNCHDAGPGSLRHAMEAEGPRMIIMNMSGPPSFRHPLYHDVICSRGVDGESRIVVSDSNE